MKGLFADNNIGEMFNDIISNKLASLFDGETEFGLGELTINVPTGERIWYNFLPVIAIITVVIMGLLICRISKRRRNGNKGEEIPNDVKKIFSEAEEDFTNVQRKTDNFTPAKFEAEPISNQGEPDPIKAEKIEVVATRPAIKFGKDNQNTTRSGRVFTEEELEALIRN